MSSFEHYLKNIKKEIPEFFQKPNKNHTGYDKMCVGKNTLAEMMKTIGEKAKLSRIYTNHQIHKTIATAMHNSGFSLKKIANVTKHKNLQSLQHYIGGADQKEKENYSNALFEYSKPQKKRRIEPKAVQAQNEQETSKPQEENIADKTALIPLQPNFDEDKNEENAIEIPQKIVQHNQNNRLQQASNLFQGATFNNCTINLQMPK